MRILIETNGQGSDTFISINDEVQSKLQFFSITVKPFKGVKLQMTREIEKDGKVKKEFISYYGGDFPKNDELYGKNGGSK